MTIFFKILFILSLLFLSFVLSSCDSSTPIGTTPVKFPESGEVSFQNHVQPFFRNNCTWAGCHDAFDPAYGLDLTNYFSMIGFNGLIIPGNPASSRLYQVIIGTNPHLLNLNIQLPDSNAKQGFYRWIFDGAMNN